MNMQSSKTSHLSTSGLCIGYRTNQKENRLFEDLDLELFPGQLVCFMGPNGAGKSSLIRTLAGLQRPLSGNIAIKAAGSSDTSRQISVVLTDRITAVNMTVEEIVAYGRYPYLDWNIRLSQSDLEIIDRAIAQVHIRHLTNHKLNQLSDGQLQMVMIARALAQDTPIILLDEPTAHLDLNNRVEIMRLLKQLAQTTNKAILVATHELDLALQMADWIWLTGRDKNMLTGMPEDLVLNGAFDAIFEFKGFDLKTGKVQHQAHKGVNVQLQGEGPEYLWTKNALERNGFLVTNESASISISMTLEGSTIQWQVKQRDTLHKVRSLAELIREISV